MRNSCFPLQSNVPQKKDVLQSYHFSTNASVPPMRKALVLVAMLLTFLFIVSDFQWHCLRNSPSTCSSWLEGSGLGIGKRMMQANSKRQGHCQELFCAKVVWPFSRKRQCVSNRTASKQKLSASPPWNSFNQTEKNYVLVSKQILKHQPIPALHTFFLFLMQQQGICISHGGGCISHPT